MENAPALPEDDDDNSSEGKDRKKKRAALLGGISVEPKTETVKRADDNKKELSLIDWLRGEKAESADNEEVSAAEAPLEVLSAGETQQVESELVRQLPAVETPSAELAAAQPDEVAAAEAVDVFRAKIVEEGLDSNQALAETLAVVGVEAEPAMEAQAKEPAEEAPQEITEEPLDLRTPETAPPPPVADEAEEEPEDNNDRRRTRANALVMPTAPAAAPIPVQAPEKNRQETRDNSLGAAVVGGIVGYLIGRRRGRIKTERRLKPVQAKLEKQVKNIHSELLDKEARLRQVAKRQAHLEGLVLAERLRRAKPETTVRHPERVIAPEARHLHKKQSHERIGKVLIGAEAAARPSSTEQLKIERSVATMTRADLLAASQKIIIDGSSLRAIYENNLLGEKGLRRLVAEHLRGGDIRRSLRREMVERQIDFERDPAMRDIGALDTPTSGGDNLKLQQMLAHAEAMTNNDEDHHQAILEARAERQKAAAQKEKERRRAADLTVAAFICTLLGLVIFLLITR